MTSVLNLLTQPRIIRLVSPAVPIVCLILMAPTLCLGQAILRESNLANWHYSDLRQITAENVAQLQPAWTFHAGSGRLAAPLALGGFLYVTDSGGDVFALELASGHLAWHYARRTSSPAARRSLNLNLGLAAEWGRLFLVTPEGQLLALDRRTGRVDWERNMKAIGPPFTMGLGYVIVAARENLAGPNRVGRHSTLLCGFFSETGEPRWRVRLPAAALSARGAVDLGRDLLLWGLAGPQGFVTLDPFSGETRSPPVYTPRSPMSEVLLEPAVVEQNAVLVPAGSAYDPDLGRWYFRNPQAIEAENSWQFPLDKPAGVLATAGGLVFAGGADERLIALDSRSGKLLWSRGLGARVTSAPITYLDSGTQDIAVAAANGWHIFRRP